MHIPLDKQIKRLSDVPYTISYVIRKRQQIDTFNELPKEKRPTDKLIWDGNADEMEEWFDKVVRTEYGKDSDNIIIIDKDIED